MCGNPKTAHDGLSRPLPPLAHGRPSPAFWGLMSRHFALFPNGFRAPVSASAAPPTPAKSRRRQPAARSRAHGRVGTESATPPRVGARQRHRPGPEARAGRWCVKRRASAELVQGRAGQKLLGHGQRHWSRQVCCTLTSRQRHSSSRSAVSDRRRASRRSCSGDRSSHEASASTAVRWPSGHPKTSIASSPSDMVSP